jgi:hypothetical protein
MKNVVKLLIVLLTIVFVVGCEKAVYDISGPSIQSCVQFQNIWIQYYTREGNIGIHNVVYNNSEIHLDSLRITWFAWVGDAQYASNYVKVIHASAGGLDPYGSTSTGTAVPVTCKNFQFGEVDSVTYEYRAWWASSKNMRIY